MSDAAVSLQELGRTFGDTMAVQGLTFDVPHGGLFGIVGPDGAGKTTTLRMLAGVLRPTSGTALVLGLDVRRDPETVKPHIAYMAQRFGLYEDLTVRENLDFYADLYTVPTDERPARVERLHHFSGLGPFENRLAGALSGGMKQKLALSCCLVHRPEILLLDEPTFGVDPISRRDLWMILYEMVAEGVTVILSTSYLDEAERCDHVAILDEGRVLALDEPATLQGSLDGNVWAVGAADPRGARDVMVGMNDLRGAALFGQEVHVLAPAALDSEHIRNALGARGVDVTALRRIDPSLEDVFIQLVGDEEGSGRRG